MCLLADNKDNYPFTSKPIKAFSLRIKQRVLQPQHELEVPGLSFALIAIKLYLIANDGEQITQEL